MSAEVAWIFKNEVPTKTQWHGFILQGRSADGHDIVRLEKQWMMVFIDPWGHDQIRIQRENEYYVEFRYAEWISLNIAIEEAYALLGRHP